MYSVATLVFGKAAHLGFMEPLARFMLWIAVAAWTLVATAFLARLARRPHEPVPGPRRHSSGRLLAELLPLPRRLKFTEPDRC
jgi:hypothetical protein